MSARQISDQSDQELQNLIDNHRRLGMTTEPRFLLALEEMQRRKGGGLDFGKSMALILEAAKERRYVSYKELSDESGAIWSKVHYRIGKHLGELIEYAHLKGWPLLSAIVVNAKGVGSGTIKPATLEGFVKAARSLGYPVLDETAFLMDQQERVFQWASSRETDVASATTFG